MTSSNKVGLRADEPRDHHRRIRLEPRIAAPRRERHLPAPPAWQRPLLATLVALGISFVGAGAWAARDALATPLANAPSPLGSDAQVLAAGSPSALWPALLFSLVAALCFVAVGALVNLRAHHRSGTMARRSLG
jgi:hypothetical protein